MHRRVVITGLGAVTPLGCETKISWKNLIEGKSGIRSFSRPDIPSDFPSRVAGQIPLDGPEPFVAEDWMDAKIKKRSAEFVQYAVCAAKQAFADADLGLLSQEEKNNVAVIVGSGVGGMSEIEKAAITLKDRGMRAISPIFVPLILASSAAGTISIDLNLRGPNYGTVSACSSSAHSIIDAVKSIRLGECEIVMAGGSESALSYLGFSGFAAMRALSTKYNETPEKASRPYDAGRDGFVMGEGAGILIIESEESALKRGVKIYAEITGYGASGDAYHITAPETNGAGALLAMQRALRDSNLEADQIDYVNAHATSTPVGDEAELKAITSAFSGRKRNLFVSSNKSAIGHLLGACGAVELIFSALTINNSIIPPTLNLYNPPQDLWDKIDLVPHVAKEANCKFAMSNSFGFGGTNASIILKRYEK